MWNRIVYGFIFILLCARTVWIIYTPHYGYITHSIEVINDLMYFGLVESERKKER